MKKYKLAVINGDGIGPEIISQAEKVLKSVEKRFGFSTEITHCLMGGCAIDECNEPLPRKTLEICKSSDAVLMGAVGGPKWDKGAPDKRPEAGLLGIRKGLGLYCNIRPAKIFAPLKNMSPLKNEIIDNADLVIYRELISGIYFGERDTVVANNVESAYDTMYYSENEIKRMAKTAFEAALTRRNKLTLVDKANILDSSRLWRKTVTAISKEYPEVEFNCLYVDNAAMQLVANPGQFDVILTSNMFGDILSDEASQICGSIGMIPSASLGNGNMGLYEPIHGSAPSIAGTGEANPCAAVLSLAMLLKMSFDEPEAAAAVEKAVDNYLCENRTKDIYESGTRLVTTSEAGDIISRLVMNV